MVSGQIGSFSSLLFSRRVEPHVGGSCGGEKNGHGDLGGGDDDFS